MGFVLFGHSFVRRLSGRRRATVDIELEGGNVPVSCLGERGLTLSRIKANRYHYYRMIAQEKPSILIIDLGTNDLCTVSVTPKCVCDMLCNFVRDLPKHGIKPSVVVFLPVLPRTGNMRQGQVPVSEFNEKADVFNELLGAEIMREDLWWVWHHRGLKHPRYNLDGVHLDQLGMNQYQRTIRQIVKYFERRCW